MVAAVTILYTNNTGITNLVNLITKGLNTIIYGWLFDNRLCVNIKKSKYIIFGLIHQLNSLRCKLEGQT